MGSPVFYRPVLHRFRHHIRSRGGQFTAVVHHPDDLFVNILRQPLPHGSPGKHFAGKNFFHINYFAHFSPHFCAAFAPVFPYKPGRKESPFLPAARGADCVSSQFLCTPCANKKCPKKYLEHLCSELIFILKDFSFVFYKIHEYPPNCNTSFLIL